MKRSLLIVFSVSLPLFLNAQVQFTKLDSLITRSVGEEFSGVIQISSKNSGDYIFSKNFDMHESPENIKFPIASITKLFTSIIIFQLIEENKLSLSTSFSNKDLEFIPEDYGEITVEELLLHTSAFPKEPDSLFFKVLGPKNFIRETLAQAARNIDHEFLYKNVDYILLGLIIERVTGNKYTNELHSRILKPLDMSDTGLITDQSMYSALPKYEDPENLIDFPAIPGKTFFLQNYFSAGAMYSTAADLKKIDKGLRGNNLLTAKSKKIMFTSYPEYNYSSYGSWVYHYPFAESQPRLMERRGSILGYNSVLIFFLDTDISIIILSNSTSFNPNSFGDKSNLKEILIKEMAIKD